MLNAFLYEYLSIHIVVSRIIRLSCIRPVFYYLSPSRETSLHLRRAYGTSVQQFVKGCFSIPISGVDKPNYIELNLEHVLCSTHIN